MSKLAIICALAVMAAPAAARQALFPAPDGGHLLLVASMRHLVRSDDPPLIQQPDKRIEVSNGCGYDTAIVEVREQLLGEYRFELVSAHLRVGEFCTSLFQPEVRDYLLALFWNGASWEVDERLSARLIPDEHGQLWIAEPELIAQIEQAGGPRAAPVIFSRDMLEDIATGHELRRGAAPPPDQTKEAWIKELENLRPVSGEWPGNPLYFNKGVPLPLLEAWLSANKSFKRTRNLIQFR